MRRSEENLSSGDGSSSPSPRPTPPPLAATGLELAISSQLARMMGGEMDVENPPGLGSTLLFTAQFEKRPESATRCQANLKNPSVSGAPSVLLLGSCPSAVRAC